MANVLGILRAFPTSLSATTSEVFVIVIKRLINESQIAALNQRHLLSRSGSLRSLSGRLVLSFDDLL
jgi:hypothetical protein